MSESLSDEIIKAIRGIRSIPKDQIKNPFEIQLIVANLYESETVKLASDE